MPKLFVSRPAYDPSLSIYPCSRQMTVLEDRCADLQRRVDESAPQVTQSEKAHKKCLCRKPFDLFLHTPHRNKQFGGGESRASRDILLTRVCFFLSRVSQSEVEKAQNETAAVAAAWRETSIVRPFVAIV